VAVSKARGGEWRLSFAPDNQRHLQDGIAVLERTLGPTLGPGGRAVAIERIGRPHLPPELLDDGSTIARRITGIPDHFANMGLMLARHAAWKMRTEVHDGAATAVVILASAHRELQKQIAAGANRVELKSQVESAIARAIALIAESATPLAPSDDRHARLAGTADRTRMHRRRALGIDVGHRTARRTQYKTATQPSARSPVGRSPRRCPLTRNRARTPPQRWRPRGPDRRPIVLS
jgi:chaperonin GroEL (HSP60 family)